jgi:sugar phosphate isomerase/epimerase
MKRMGSRRNFLKTAGMCAVGARLLPESMAWGTGPLSRPIGLHLYTVGEDFDKDPFGTLEKVAAIGYREVELPSRSKVSVKDIKKALADSGLKNPSGHYTIWVSRPTRIIPSRLSDLIGHVQEKIDTAKELGQEFMIVSIPWVGDPARYQAANDMDMFRNIINGLTLDDWKWSAEQFNTMGELIKKAGLQLGYNNFNFEFRKFGETSGYDEFLRLTDPQLVALELDCGMMAVAGLDPVMYLTKYPGRYRLLQVTDFEKGFNPSTAILGDPSAPPVPTELGRGTIDYGRILGAASSGNIRALFVEQMPPFKEMPPLEAIKVDFDYLHNLKI